MSDTPGILARLHAAGLRPRKALGQNFLHDPGLLRALVDAADLPPDATVLEIGTGPGTLTRAIAERAARVLSIEIDADLARFARSELAGLDHVEILVRDALASKSQLDPELLGRLRGLGEFWWISNLPYSVATPLIVAVLEAGIAWRRAVLTLQLEVAERLVAEPGHPAYGAVSVLVRFFARAHILRRVGAGTFWPRPKVESAAVVLEPLGTDRSTYPALKSWVRFLFQERRKQIGKRIRERLGDPRRADAFIAAQGWSPTARAEELSLADFVRLATEFR